MQFSLLAAALIAVSYVYSLPIDVAVLQRRSSCVYARTEKAGSVQDFCSDGAHMTISAEREGDIAVAVAATTVTIPLADTSDEYEKRSSCVYARTERTGSVQDFCSDGAHMTIHEVEEESHRESTGATEDLSAPAIASRSSCVYDGEQGVGHPTEFCSDGAHMTVVSEGEDASEA
ncbi:hypothetical protein BXZ70DRAFT_1011167 [Cristinia sonorae]|uniref:Uncharacterized protein n=1 Tax=Cristinia sonorae TaxID=1940300 RepID=A0A8K0UGS3_9AGAR|nr:hypothetical protein BXZ70DRAFT_1011167 [Cristinia sonorae]